MPPRRFANFKRVQRNPTPEERAFLRDTLMRNAQVAEARPGVFTVRDEANAIVAEAFRNGPLECLHLGRHSELLEDDSLSRVTDEEMKALMLNACETMEELLRLRESNPEEYAKHVRAYHFNYCRAWDRGPGSPPAGGECAP